MAATSVDAEPVLAVAALQALTSVAGHGCSQLTEDLNNELLNTITKCLKPGSLFLWCWTFRFIISFPRRALGHCMV